MNYSYKRVLSFLNSPKDLDPSYKMDLEFWDCFGGKINMVPTLRSEKKKEKW